MKKINIENPVERNYYGIKEAFVSFLVDNKMSVEADEDEGTATVFDASGNDIAHMTLKQLSRRIKL